MYQPFLSQLGNNLVTNNNHFYQYDSKKYALLSDEYLCRLFYQSEIFNKDKSLNYNNIMTHIKTLKLEVPMVTKNTPHFIEGEANQSFYIPLENNILELSIKSSYLIRRKLNHTQNFFCKYNLPFCYSPKAGCKIFINFLNSILTKEDIYLLQEWAGYLLIPSNLAQKMMIFYGNGANGKSVLCLVLSLLIGEENISSVPIHAFQPNSRFSLSETEDKLANIVEEIDELDSVVTAQLKQYASGSSISIERKYERSYRITPTARLTFATNTLPFFKDSSDGIWRRLLIIHFKKQFLNPSEQRKEFSDKNFWLNSNELSGIFNWALKGLERLIRNNWKFSDYQELNENLDEYRKNSNPIEQFFSDCITFEPGSFIPSKTLYLSYERYRKDYGYRMINHGDFTKTVKKLFPQIQISKNAEAIQGIGRTKVWHGIGYQHH